MPFLYFSFFIMSLAHSFEIQVPITMEGVAKENNFQKEITYKLIGEKEKKTIPIVQNSNAKTVEEFMGNLFWIYKNDKKGMFFDLFEPNTAKVLKQIPKKDFEQSWNQLRFIKKPFIDHYYEYENGFFVSWNDDILPVPRALYLENSNNKLRIKNIEIGSDDKKFENIELYFKHKPLPLEKSQIIKKFSFSDTKYELKVMIPENKKWVTILKKEDGMWKPKVVIKDNVVGKFKFDDLDRLNGTGLIRFEDHHFSSKTKQELLILSSNYPIQEFPIQFYPQGNLIIE
ncbi:MAG: hypothetical protein CME62_15800 [Halobacteriovoraceae bacterium]|nr:hypothetical protein [Halobacteriovoraceae bacterium]|tara:strand:- start:11500 stop:12357 length:858 start_codon:yes stop_codon:yes gene_type:complete